ncbi:MAG: alpha-ribazole phosphatase [Muribaculaceae bacterium]|nr:alpha-ribazole phosphatase [Muribaculaceae bacterium]
MKITLVRHTSVDVPQGVCYGQSDVPLRATFVREAETVREKLKGLRFDAVYTSPLSRCVKLASYCGYDDAVRDGRLMEMNFGEWEMQRWDEIKDPRLNEWFEDWFHVQATGGESSEQQQQRLRQFLEEIRTNDKENVLLFTHGGIMIHMLLLSGAATLDNVFSQQPDYAGILQIEL